MKFVLTTSKSFYGDSEPEDIELLKSLGFTFKKPEWAKNETWDRFDLTINGCPTIEINTLEELIDLKNKIGNSLIIADYDQDKNEYEIEIYDGPRE